MDMLKKVWEGNERLVITFWVWGFLGSFVVGFVLGFLLAFAGIDSPLVISLLVLPYSVFIWVSVWRSSDNYKGQSIWALLAKIMVALGVIWTVYGFINPTPMPF